MNKKYIPYIIGVPNMGVGLLWAMNLALIPTIVGRITDSSFRQGLLISMGALTGVFVQYLAGALSDRSEFKMGKRKPFILMGTLSTIIFICLLPFAKGYLLLFLLAFGFYFSLNFYQGPYYSLIPEMVEEKQLGLANGFSKVVSVLGSAIIFVAGPVLMERNIAAPFFLAAVLGFITVIPAMIIIKEEAKKFTRKPTKLSFDFLNYPSVIKLYIASFFIFLSYGCITPFFVKYCASALNLSESTASTGLLLLTISGALFAVPIGKLCDRIERRKVLFLGALIFASCLLAASFVKGTSWLFLLLAFIGIGFISIQITIYTILAEIVPPERMGEFMGLLNLFISLGQFITNNVMGYILDNFGYMYYFPVSSILMFIAVGILGFSKFEKFSRSEIRGVDNAR